MKRKTYPTDLSCQQWKLLAPMLPPRERFGRKRSVDLREIFDALCYSARSGSQWRLLPKEYRKRQTVYYYFRLWRDCECFIVVNDRLRAKLRQRAGKNADPSAAIIDSQSVKTDEQANSRGFDAGKKLRGHKRCTLVDALGLPLKTKVLKADVRDRDAAKMLLTGIKDRMPRLSSVWADGGYRGKLIIRVAVQCLWILEIVKRNDQLKKFMALPERWIVERTFSWLNRESIHCQRQWISFTRSRRLGKDCERKIESSEAWLYLSMLVLMLKRFKN